VRRSSAFIDDSIKQEKKTGRVRAGESFRVKKAIRCDGGPKACAKRKRRRAPRESTCRGVSGPWNLPKWECRIRHIRIKKSEVLKKPPLRRWKIRLKVNINRQ